MRPSYLSPQTFTSDKILEPGWENLTLVRVRGRTDLGSSSFLSHQTRVGIQSLEKHHLIRQTQIFSPNPRTVAGGGHLGYDKEFKDKEKAAQIILQLLLGHVSKVCLCIVCLKFNPSSQRNRITDGCWALISDLKC